MLIFILLLLFIFWLLGYSALPTRLFAFSGHYITLWDLFIFVLVVWLISLLPGPFAEIATVLIILWLLSVFGVISIVGMPNIIILALIVGLLIYVLRF